MGSKGAYRWKRCPHGSFFAAVSSVIQIEHVSLNAVISSGVASGNLPRDEIFVFFCEVAKKRGQAGWQPFSVMGKTDMWRKPTCRFRSRVGVRSPEKIFTFRGGCGFSPSRIERQN